MLEVREVEATVVVGSELICDVDYDLVAVVVEQEVVGQAFADFEDLVVGTDKFVKLERSQRID